MPARWSSSGTGSSALVVQGTLRAGDRAARRLHVDPRTTRSGGDTNNDGPQSNPQPRQWAQILFTSTSTASVLDHVVVHYGGDNVGGEVEADGSAPTIRNSTIAVRPLGVQLIGSAAVLTGDTFRRTA